MHAMQYEITLPADYDMGVVRHRVATRGGLLDDLPGLGVKAYLVRERGRDGSPVNQYAPFYLWRTPEGMNAFLWGAGFDGIVRDFGRPRVRHWIGAAYQEGTARGAVAAVRSVRALPEGVPPAGLLEEAVARTGLLASREGAVCAAAAVDPAHWELVVFSLWNRPAPEAEGERFQVLHVSAPERALLPRGRHW